MLARAVAAWVLAHRWTLLVLGAFALWHGAVYGVYRWRTSRAPTPAPPPPEVALGDFRFQADPASGASIISATFALHVVFLPETESEARQRLQARQLRVRQDIEQLLRRAHGADFEDPALGELKRQIQAQINQTLQLRCVSEVIITGLCVQRRADSDTRRS